MQALSKAVADALARLRKEAEAYGPGAEQVMGSFVDGAPPRGWTDGGGYGTVGEDTRPEWLREQDEPGWELLVTLNPNSRR